jgi:hypothetical protein
MPAQVIHLVGLSAQQWQLVLQCIGMVGPNQPPPVQQALATIGRNINEQMENTQ